MNSNASYTLLQGLIILNSNPDLTIQDNRMQALKLQLNYAEYIERYEKTAGRSDTDTNILPATPYPGPDAAQKPSESTLMIGMRLPLTSCDSLTSEVSDGQPQLSFTGTMLISKTPTDVFTEEMHDQVNGPEPPS